MEGGIRVLVPFACCNGISVMLLLYASGVAVILLSHYTSPNSNRRIPTWQSKDITQIFALLAEFGEASNSSPLSANYQNGCNGGDLKPYNFNNDRIKFGWDIGKI